MHSSLDDPEDFLIHFTHHARSYGPEPRYFTDFLKSSKLEVLMKMFEYANIGVYRTFHGFLFFWLTFGLSIFWVENFLIYQVIFIITFFWKLVSKELFTWIFGFVFCCLAFFFGTKASLKSEENSFSRSSISSEENSLSRSSISSKSDFLKDS